ncbi:hypothetical protein I4I73_26390 [Pseudonocardia sp. KRD-184]|uniref:Ribosomally synthesized peptide with SipW-like signal peptide n=1 Tax=Pseudonocardia oceani TaxID=2792013 RepID=A0ABS6UFJ4_9PSEU|nr:hypothetical protein [Pseudonocardia oceani]MBW0092724.1 hypothetical protein [Pseudonocardia oceani]MBW0099527.1 hypothetical protein [Pseudonocardia oceani]MBW0112144.1 hypothetical protein [Pseudonocardia oceani]MBW0124543.1 hypothetical protein [Pseudonocardia oceani]MBW0130969.1 hypothetical protein [Pseudonocardia oceani]
MGTHSHPIRRTGRGRRLALALTGAATAGVVTVTGLGVANAAPLPAIPGLDLLQPSGNTEVNEDFAPFAETDTRPDGDVEVNEDFGAPAGGGTGSLRLDTPSSAAKATLFRAATSPLADWVDVAAYSAFRSSESTANEVQFPSLQLVIDFNGDADGGFSTLTYEPVYNTDAGASLTAGQWNRYAAGSQGWCSTRVIPGVFGDGQNQCSNGGVLTLAEIADALPDGVVTAFGVNQGSGNPGLTSAVDLLTTPGTTYDFEEKGPIVVVPEPPLPGGGNGHGGGHGGGDGHHGGGHDNGNGHGGGHDNGKGGHGAVHQSNSK